MINFVNIKWNDPRFMMNNGFVNSGVASIQITKDCPDKYKLMIMEAFNRGWLVPYAIIKQELDYCI